MKPILGPLVTKYLGTVVKKRRGGRPVDSLNVASYPTAFYLTCLPVHALRQMWILQVCIQRVCMTYRCNVHEVRGYFARRIYLVWYVLEYMSFHV